MLVDLTLSEATARGFESDSFKEGWALRRRFNKLVLLSGETFESEKNRILGQYTRITKVLLQYIPEALVDSRGCKGSIDGAGNLGTFIPCRSVLSFDKVTLLGGSDVHIKVMS
jgi:hypothetical protein